MRDKPPSIPWAVGLVILGLSSSAAQTGRKSEPPTAPRKGVFLVADPKIDGGPFWQSVVLLLRHSGEGSLGLIVNRPTEIPLEEALPELEKKWGEGSEEPQALYFGGPVAMNGLLFLFRTDDPPEGASPVMKDVHYSGDRKILEALMEEGKSDRTLRLYLGYAGWAPGQLDAELRRGDWAMLEGDPFTVFYKDAETIWPELSGKTSRTTVARRRDPGTEKPRTAAASRR